LQIVVDSEKLPLDEFKKTISFLFQKDLEFKRILKYNHKYSIWDSTNVVLSKAEDFLDPDFVFNKIDYISAYKKTTGISHFEFNFKDQNFSIYDTGGQRNERLKWSKVLGDADLRIFCSLLFQQRPPLNGCHE
jgi:hypothetical protein